MRNVLKVCVSVGAAIAITATLCAVPAAASGKRSVAAENDTIDMSQSRSAMAWAPREKQGTRHKRRVRSYPARIASLARPGCNPAFPCVRPFVLILGIGF